MRDYPQLTLRGRRRELRFAQYEPDRLCVAAYVCTRYADEELAFASDEVDRVRLDEDLDQQPLIWVGSASFRLLPAEAARLLERFPWIRDDRLQVRSARAAWAAEHRTDEAFAP